MSQTATIKNLPEAFEVVKVGGTWMSRPCVMQQLTAPVLRLQSHGRVGGLIFEFAMDWA